MMRAKHKIVAIDLDETIIRTAIDEENFHLYSPVEITGNPMEDVVEALNILRDSGFEIVIYTCRTNPEEECNMPHTSEAVEVRIRLKLKALKIPFDRISFYKPVADIYIDDKGFHFENWKQTMQALFEFGWINKKIGE